MAHRRGEFSRHVREEARRLAGYACEHCGKEGYTEVHHILPLAIAAEYYPQIAPAILSSLCNAMCLCRKCHKQFDAEAVRNHAKYAEYLVNAAGVQHSFFDHLR